MTPEVVAESFCTPEAPRWQDGRLWFSDILRGRVYSMSPGEKPQLEIDHDDEVSGLGFLPDGRLLFVAGRERRVLRVETDGRIAVHADLREISDGSCNDMVVDPQGRAYVGAFGWRLDEQPLPPDPTPSAQIALVGTDGNSRKVGTPLRCPNGIAITPDGRTLIAAETFAARLSAYDIAADGALRHPRVWAEVPDQAPDGICVDAEGCVWVGLAYGGRAIRLREGGEILEEIPVPGAAGVLAPALGGADRRTLYLTYVTSLPEGTEEAQAALRSSDNGGIAAVRVTVAGAGRP